MSELLNTPSLPPLLSFIPHGHCYLWKPGLVWLHLLSDSLIALAYYSIPLTLFYFVRKRQDLPYSWLFLMFGAFIIACGTTHLMEVWTLWHPTYWLSGAIKAITAMVSAFTAITLVPLVPQALALPSPGQLETANQELQQQIAQALRSEQERLQAEAALRRAHNDSEICVQERTSELLQLNQALQVEIADRKRAEEALRDSEERFHAAFEYTAIGMALVSLEGQWLQVNHALCEMLGYSEQELLATNQEAITHPDDLDIDLEYARQILTGELRSCHMEKRYYHKHGQLVWALLSISLVPNAHGEALYFVVQIQDITKSKQTLEELQQQNRRSQLFADVALKIRQSLQIEEILQTTVTEVQRILACDRVLLFQIWPDGSGTVAQESVVAGWPVTLGQSYMEPCFQQGYIERYRQGRVSAIFDINNADIQPCHVEFLRQFGVQANLVVPILLRENLWGLLVAHHCASPRQWTSDEIELLKQLANQIGIALAQAQLLEQEILNSREIARSQQELRTMSTALESAVEGISQVDTQGCYIFVNQAYASMVGYQPTEMIGIKWHTFVHPEDQEKMSNSYQYMLANGKTEVEARAVRQDGSVFDKQVVMVKAYDQQQQFIGHYCFMKDISDRREIERLKDEFISVVSHELRTPLTSISGALDLLAAGVLQTQPQEAQRMLDIAANNTERLVRLINDILDIERIESGKVTMTKQACNAANLMTQSADVMQEMAQRAGITLSLVPFSVRLWADPDRIIQVLTNLLSNAIKFSAPGSTVWLSAEMLKADTLELALNTQQTILFKVKDQGRGIPNDKLESIFERFQQVDASDSRSKGGTGLGLAICRSIVQHHGGRIWAESTLGEGSTFSFTLPVLWEAEAGVATTIDSSSPLVLICDDDSSVRAVVQTMLERQGYQVLVVASGQEAVEQAAAQLPDVILLNLMMPGMNGWETLAILKQQSDTENIPVIILSGLLPDARVTPPLGVSDWIVKPPALRLLCQALEKALAKQNQTIKVLIVEDDLDLARVLNTTFTRHGIETFHAQTGREAIQLSQRIIPDLLVLDLGIPEYDGFAVVDWLRHHNRLSRVPLVVYTAQDLDNSDRERLKLGQTLFLTKGRITPQEFEQRVINLLNRITQ